MRIVSHSRWIVVAAVLAVATLSACSSDVPNFPTPRPPPSPAPTAEPTIWPPPTQEVRVSEKKFGPLTSASGFTLTCEVVNDSSEPIVKIVEARARPDLNYQAEQKLRREITVAAQGLLWVEFDFPDLVAEDRFFFGCYLR